MNQEIQILRAVFFLEIFLFYVGFPWAAMEWMGVQAFLVLINYFLAQKLLRPDSLNFNPLLMVWQRAKRLAPVYYTLVLVLAFVFIAYKQSMCLQEYLY